MSKKKRERRLNTSASVVSKRLLYVVWSSRTSFRRVTADQKDAVNRCHNQRDNVTAQVEGMQVAKVRVTHPA